MGSLCIAAAASAAALFAAASFAALPSVEPSRVGSPSIAVVSDENPRAHRHEIVIDLGRTPPRDVLIVVELTGARRPARLTRRFAAGAMSLAAGLVVGPAASVVPQLADSMAEEVTGAGDSVFAVRGRSLRSLGGGLYVLRFQCVHDPGGASAVRVTVRPRKATAAAVPAGDWQSLEAPSSALSSGQLPE